MIDIDKVVKSIAAYILDINEEDVDADQRRFAAFQCDSVFYEELFSEIDFKNLTLPRLPETDVGIYGRTDINIGLSIFDEEIFMESTDIGLQKLFDRQNSGLYGTQLATLIDQERFDLEQIEDQLTCFVRIQFDEEDLVSTLRALLMLNDFPNVAIPIHEFYEVDETHKTFIDTIESTKLRNHVGAFFQDANAARCFGAALQSYETDIFSIDKIKCYKHVVSWWMGEGQGQISLMEIVNDEILTIPLLKVSQPFVANREL